MHFNWFDTFPPELLTAKASDVDSILGGPSIIHLNQDAPEHLFISCLLHGNETTGFYAIIELVKSLFGEKLDRGLILFFGNTKAAALMLRQSPGEVDYNRIWTTGDLPEHRISHDVLEYCKKRKIFAAIDIHNNTGKNPYYGCINVIREDYLCLARAFSKKVVYFTEPKEVCSMAFAQFTPSVTIEAGQPDLVEGIDKVANYIKKIYHLKDLSQIKPEFESPVFHTHARIKVHKGARIDFRNELTKNVDISLISTLELLNFDFIHEGKALGWCRDRSFFYAVDNNGEDVTNEYFEFFESRIITKKMFIPSMFTMNEGILKEDCLGYIMQILK